MASSLKERVSTIRSSFISTMILKIDKSTPPLKSSFQEKIIYGSDQEKIIYGSDQEKIIYGSDQEKIIYGSDQPPEASNIDWNPEDKQLINWVLNNFWTTSSTLFCKELWDFLQKKLTLGPGGQEALSGILRDGFRFLQREIRENRRRK